MSTRVVAHFAGNVLLRLGLFSCLTVDALEASGHRKIPKGAPKRSSAAMRPGAIMPGDMGSVVNFRRTRGARRNFRWSPVLAVAGSLFIALGLLAVAAAKKAPRYDGHWWLSVSGDEQLGFLNGYADCYAYEYKGPAKFTINPPDIIARDLVTKFYRHNVSRLADPVAKVFYGLRDRPGQKSTASDGQPHRGPHGYYHGLYWGELYGGNTSGSRTSGQLGYVQGYLDCHARLNHNKGGVFSKPPSDYVKLINRWYGFIPHNETYLLKRESVPIADVLFKFRDRPQRSKSARPRP